MLLGIGTRTKLRAVRRQPRAYDRRYCRKYSNMYDKWSKAKGEWRVCVGGSKAKERQRMDDMKETEEVRRGREKLGKST